MWNYAAAPTEVVDRVRALGAVADEFAVPLAAAALQFPLANDIITSVIPGPRNAAELQQILDWFNLPIPAAFWAALKSRDLLTADTPVPAGT
jgi:D-threo-aldose 1-dehydrogenase